MKVIRATNVNDALMHGLDYLKQHGVEEPSRNGPVLVAPCPVITQYLRPDQRVIFSAERDANPFFHLMESLWMLAGRNDVKLPAYFAAQMQLYSDDNETLNGSAYGHRWRTYFGYDQLEVIIKELKANPASRRCVLAMWDATDSRWVERLETATPEQAPYMGDLNFAMAGGKDIPCNTQVYFRIQSGLLDMTVCNRSNDVVWGAYGANAVHFSVLHEFMAGMIGCDIGLYYQLSNNYHVYTEREDTKKLLKGVHYPDQRYSVSREDRVYPTQVVTRPDLWALELAAFIGGGVPSGLSDGAHFLNPIISVAAIMATAHRMYKDNQLPEAARYLRANNSRGSDWLVAGAEWLERRIAARAAKAAQ